MEEIILGKIQYLLGEISGNELRWPMQTEGCNRLFEKLPVGFAQRERKCHAKVIAWRLSLAVSSS